MVSLKIQHIAIVGLGSIGRRHLRLIRALRPELEITLVRSGIGQFWPEESLAQRKVDSISEAIKAGVQAAIISSPSSFHIHQALEFVHSGVHLLIEKPLSHDLQNVSELLSLASEQSIIVLVGYVLRYDPAARFFKEQLQRRIIGTILHASIECGSYLPDWRPEQDYRQSVSAQKELGGGVLLELSHEIDYAYWFFGEIQEVQAYLHFSNTLDISVEDMAQLLLFSQDSVPIQMHLDFYRRHPKRCCVVHGTEGELVWDAIAGEVLYRPATGKSETTSFSSERDHMYREQLHHLMVCLENEESPIVSLNDGMKVLNIIEAARHSHSTGGKVVL
jgi:predicted dehydrogenase